jgi:Mg/Co/Ni transporter MgtE
MSPDFVAITDTSTVAEALEAVRSSTASAQQCADIFVTGEGGRLLGAVPLVALVRAVSTGRVSQLIQRGSTAVRADDDFPDVATLMADFNLIVAPVVDDDERIIGVISVDDLLEAMLPESWRRRAEADAD